MLRTGLFMFGLAGLAAAEMVTLETGAARAVFDLDGGGLVNFHLTDQKLNPLTWDSKQPQAARPKGHFICFDRWGAPSAAEGANGMPYHGEGPHVVWRKGAAAGPDSVMSAVLPIAGMAIERKARLEGQVLKVVETVKNTNKLGRVFNLVQHPSIAPPFLDATTVVDSNARKGFMQSSPMPNPEGPPVWWPQALKDGQPVDMRRLSDDATPNVVSYTLDEELGWTTAATPPKGLLIGYVWRVSEYPWLSMWRDTQGGRPAARGLEFGTTGLHQPPEILVAKNKIFGRRVYAYLDAGASQTKSYAAFLMKVPADFRGAARVTHEGGKLVVHERGSERRFEIAAGQLFPE